MARSSRPPVQVFINSYRGRDAVTALGVCLMFWTPFPLLTFFLFVYFGHSICKYDAGFDLMATRRHCCTPSSPTSAVHHRSRQKISEATGKWETFRWSPFLGEHFVDPRVQPPGSLPSGNLPTPTQLWVMLKSPVYTQNQRFTQSVLADYKKEVIALKKRLGLWKGQHVCFLSLVRRNLFLAPDRQTRVCRRVSACKTGLRNSWTAGAQLGIILIPRLLVSWLCLVFVPCRVNFKACKRNCSRRHLEKYIWWKMLLSNKSFFLSPNRKK